MNWLPEGAYRDSCVHPPFIISDLLDLSRRAVSVSPARNKLTPALSLFLTSTRLRGAAVCAGKPLL